MKKKIHLRNKWWFEKSGIGIPVCRCKYYYGFSFNTTTSLDRITCKHCKNILTRYGEGIGSQ